MSRLFFSSLSGVDYGGSIDPLSLNPTVYFQAFDTTYLTPSSPSSGTSITEIRQYTAETYSAITAATDCAPTWDVLGGQNLLYFPAIYGSCWPTPCVATCDGSYYTTNQNISFMSTSGYSFTLYLVVKPLSGRTADLSSNLNFILNDDPLYLPLPRTSNVEYIAVVDNKDIYLKTETDNYNTILNVPIEINSDETELQSKNLRIFSIRAQDTRDLINNSVFTYVNGIQTTAMTQSTVTTGTTIGIDFSLGGVNPTNSIVEELYQGYFGELIIFNTMHSTDTHSKIITFLKNRWGIS